MLLHLIRKLGIPLMAVLAAHALVFVVPPAAWSHDHRAPQAVLRADEESQVGYVVEKTWSRRLSSKWCTSRNVLFPMRFPSRAMKVDPARDIVVSLRKSQRLTMSS